MAKLWHPNNGMTTSETLKTMTSETLKTAFLMYKRSCWHGNIHPVCVLSLVSPLSDQNRSHISDCWLQQNVGVPLGALRSPRAGRCGAGKNRCAVVRDRGAQGEKELGVWYPHICRYPKKRWLLSHCPEEKRGDWLQAEPTCFLVEEGKGGRSYYKVEIRSIWSTNSRKKNVTYRKDQSQLWRSLPVNCLHYAYPTSPAQQDLTSYGWGIKPSLYNIISTHTGKYW